MKIKTIRVENFRSIKDEALICDDLTALVGPNGAGKSSFLRALLVFQGKQKIAAEDFYNRDTDEDVQIAVTFTDLPGAASKKFAKYVRDGDLEVVRICRHDHGAVASSLHGISPSNSGFDGVRTAPRVADALRRYDGLRQDPLYSGLPKCSTGKAAREELAKWEDDNPDKCDRPMDDGSFFGFGESSRGDLGQFVNMLYVPAVREAAWDGTESRKGSALRNLHDLTVKNGLVASIRRHDEMDAAGAVYTEAHHKADLPDPERLRGGINDTLGMLVRGAEVNYDYDLNLILDRPAVKRNAEGAEADSDYLRLLADLPPATLRLSEDGYSTTIDRTGHGLQRAFIIAMLGRLHRAQAGASASATDAGVGDDDPSIVLVIEEPELYQHPTRAKHLAGLLSSISKGGFRGVAASVQVIYATHSPYFVGADRIGQMRMLRKVDGGRDKPKTTRVWRTDMDSIRKRLADAGATRRTDPGRLEHDFDRILTPLMSEGFFADTVVLVEGETDRIAVMMAAEMLGTPLDERGVAVIPCGSKDGLRGPLGMFKELGVRTYVVWDGDNNRENEKKNNARLLSLLGMPRDEIDAGAWLGATTHDFASCEANMECLLRSDMGEEIYAPLVVRFRREYGLRGRKDKKPLLAHLMMREMKQRGMRPERLGRIVEAILDGSAAGGSSPA